VEFAAHRAHAARGQSRTSRAGHRRDPLFLPVRPGRPDRLSRLDRLRVQAEDDDDRGPRLDPALSRPPLTKMGSDPDSRPTMGPDPNSWGPVALLRRLFEVAVSAALPKHCLPGRLPSPGRGRTLVVGAGKASAAMAAAL